LVSRIASCECRYWFDVITPFFPAYLGRRQDVAVHNGNRMLHAPLRGIRSFPIQDPRHVRSANDAVPHKCGVMLLGGTVEQSVRVQGTRREGSHPLSLHHSFLRATFQRAVPRAPVRIFSLPETTAVECREGLGRTVEGFAPESGREGLHCSTLLHCVSPPYVGLHVLQKRSKMSRPFENKLAIITGASRGTYECGGVYIFRWD
jgi:hypothetical protein